MKRLVALLGVLALVAVACSDPNEDADELRSFVRSSERDPRSFTFRSVSESQAYSVKGTVEDELRYSMVLSVSGKPVLDYRVRDDALAVRLRDGGFGARIANVLGDPVVDKALKEGRWVVDPAGAPPLIRSEVKAGGVAADDPFRDAQDSLRFVDQSMGSSREVREFTLEDIEYRSALDPWRYPREGTREVRYDLIRPFLPTSEAQQTGAQGDIGPSQFRKTSVFVVGRKITQICSLVDIQGHEEFIELREKGLDSNPFLTALLRRLQRKQTAVPIEERYVFATIDYPEKASVEFPSDVITGKLETFITGLEGAFAAGLLKPTAGVSTKACRRIGADSERQR